MKFSLFSAPVLLVFLGAASLFLGSCSNTETKGLRLPARYLYIEAESLENEGMLSEALEKYTKIVKEHPGSRLGIHAYLKVADIQFKQKAWKKSETSYKMFLTFNANSSLTPYVLYKLLKINHELTFLGTIFREQEVDRDMLPNLQILDEYTRFYLLYPKSPFAKDIVPIFKFARKALAEHERLVGDYYFKQGQFNSASHRYLYLLRNYPEYPGSRLVLDKLILSYRKNRQEHQASEMERIRDQLAPEKSTKKQLALLREGASSPANR